MAKVRSKKYQQIEKRDKTNLFNLEDAVKKAQGSSYSKFEGKIELHVNVNLDSSKSDQRINFSTTLPFSTGKEVKVAVVASEDLITKAQKAGADITGSKDLIEKIGKGFMDFDVLIASPDMMSELASVARILGPKGLMPNPKNGTVTSNIEEAVENFKKGQINIRLGEEIILHLVVGSAKQKPSEVVANIEHTIKQLVGNKPAKVKGKLIKSAFVAPTMGPSFKLDLSIYQ